MALARCILGKFLGLGCHFFPPPLDVPTFSARCLHVQRHETPLAAEGGTVRGREMFRKIWPRIRFPRNSRDLLHVGNLRHGTDGFSSPPTASAGFEPTNLGTKGQHATSRPPKPLPLPCYLLQIQQSISSSMHGVALREFSLERAKCLGFFFFKTLLASCFVARQ